MIKPCAVDWYSLKEIQDKPCAVDWYSSKEIQILEKYCNNHFISVCYNVWILLQILYLIIFISYTMWFSLMLLTGLVQRKFSTYSRVISYLWVRMCDYNRVFDVIASVNHTTFSVMHYSLTYWHSWRHVGQWFSSCTMKVVSKRVVLAYFNIRQISTSRTVP